jgi:putative molybdopterin biosynthesis protein
VIRAKAGLPPEDAVTIEAIVPVRLASELGRKEFVLVALVADGDKPIAFPLDQGSGSVTTFSRADGFLEVDALRNSVDAGTSVVVTRIGNARAPELVIAGGHCVALDAVLSAQGNSARTIAIGSMGGVAAAWRGECDLAPIHLMDPQTGHYNEHYAKDGLSLVRGWQRMQGIVFSKGDTRFEGRSAQDAVATALADPYCIMVSRNAGAGTRVLIDQLIGTARPAGYGNRPRSHNAVAAAVVQGRADWGVAICHLAEMYGLGSCSSLRKITIFCW